MQMRLATALSRCSTPAVLPHALSDVPDGISASPRTHPGAVARDFDVARVLLLCTERATLETPISFLHPH